MPTPMRSRGAVVGGMGILQGHKQHGAGKEPVGRVEPARRRERPPGSFGLGILVISGQGRSMYQRLTPKAGGSNLFQEVEPQGTERTPHDTTVNQYRKNQLK